MTDDFYWLECRRVISTLADPEINRKAWIRVSAIQSLYVLKCTGDIWAVRIVLRDHQGTYYLNDWYETEDEAEEALDNTLVQLREMIKGNDQNAGN